MLIFSCCTFKFYYTIGTNEMPMFNKCIHVTYIPITQYHSLLSLKLQFKVCCCLVFIFINLREYSCLTYD